MSFARTLSSPAGVPAADLVGNDHAALALHMARCARSRGALFNLRLHLQAGRTAMAGRLVTVAFVGAALATAAAFLFH